MEGLDSRQAFEALRYVSFPGSTFFYLATGLLHCQYKCTPQPPTFRRAPELPMRQDDVMAVEMAYLELSTEPKIPPATAAPLADRPGGRISVFDGHLITPWAKQKQPIRCSALETHHVFGYLPAAAQLVGPYLPPDTC